MRKQFLQGLKRTASVGLTAVMLLSSGGTFLASGIGLTQVAAEETVIDSTEDTEHMESVDGTEDTERTGEALEAETGELPADGGYQPGTGSYRSGFQLYYRCSLISRCTGNSW